MTLFHIQGREPAAVAVHRAGASISCANQRHLCAASSLQYLIGCAAPPGAFWNLVMIFPADFAVVSAGFGFLRQ